MKVRIRDKDALLAVSPDALSAYALAAGWRRGEPYRVNSHSYAGKGLPEIIIPATRSLGDYASIVANLIDTFAQHIEQDETTVYRDLVTVDHDVVRVRADDHDHSGSLPVGAGVDIIRYSRELLLAAACSFYDPRPFYRARENKEANEYLDRVRMGQTDQGSFVVTLLSPVSLTSAAIPNLLGHGKSKAPIDRRVTKRLADALTEVRLTISHGQPVGDDTLGARTYQASTNWVAVESDVFDADYEDRGWFEASVKQGVSANLCDALAKLTKSLGEFEVSVVWARTDPSDRLRTAVRFGDGDWLYLRKLSRALRSQIDEQDAMLTGYIEALKRAEADKGGTVTIRTWMEGRERSVTAILRSPDYVRAIRAHQQGAEVVMRGDLVKSSRSWRLADASIVSVSIDGETPRDAD